MVPTLTARTEYGWTPLHLAAWNSDNPQVIKALSNIGTDPNARTEYGWTPLHVAAEQSSDHQVIETLLAIGADPFVYNQEGLSPFAIANILNKNPSAAGILLKAHTSTIEVSSDTWSPSLQRSGLYKSKCWFEADISWPNKECYFMVVREDPEDVQSTLIAFPVIRFFTHDQARGKNPVLHLGGGGPGYAMGLDSELSVSSIWSKYKRLVSQTGRDLYVIDPRGVGMAYPRLHCPEFIQEFPKGLAERMTPKEETDLMLASYLICKKRISNNYDLSLYNSRLVAQDVEYLRNSLNVDRWILYGFSYGGRYAQTIARDFSESVESMILVGAAFPNIRYTDLTAEITSNAFNRAFIQCENAGACDRVSLHQRFRDLFSNLNTYPLIIDDLSEEIKETYGVQRFTLTGDRLVSILYYAQYAASFISKIPDLVEELHHRKTGTLKDALSIWLTFQLDNTFRPLSNFEWVAV